MRDRRGDGGNLLEQEPVLVRDQIGEAHRLHVVVEADDHVDPIVARVERHIDFGDDAVGAVGVHDLHQVAAVELKHARALFHRDDAQPEHVADVPEAPPFDGADAARAAGNEAADRRRVVGGGAKPKLLAAGLRFIVDLGEHRAGFRNDAAARDLFDLVHLRKAQHDAARKRHRLAVIAGAGAARRDRHAHRKTGLQDVDHFRLALRRDDEVGGDVVELTLQDRRVPEEVAALLLHDRGIVFGLHVAERFLEGGNVGHSAAPIRSSSSE